MFKGERIEFHHTVWVPSLGHVSSVNLYTDKIDVIEEGNWLTFVAGDKAARVHVSNVRYVIGSWAPQSAANSGAERPATLPVEAVQAAPGRARAKK